MKPGRRFQTWEAAVNSFSRFLQSETTLAPRTVAFYRETVHAVLTFMEAHGLHTLPHQIERDDLIKLLDCMAAERLAVATRKGYLSALKKFLQHNGNGAFSNLVYHLPADTRPSVDWLTLDQARTLLHASKTSIQAIVVHCELCLGMRRVEVVRLQENDIHDDGQYLDVRGKGPGGGKLRAIPFAQGTAEIMQLARKRREEQIKAARPGIPVPGNLIMWSKGGKLHAYSEEGYGLDKVVTEPLSKKLGFRISNHQLRRTFGRTLYRSGAPVATIAKILGHESTEVTLRYIGVDLDDMRNVMKTDLYA